MDRPRKRQALAVLGAAVLFRSPMPLSSACDRIRSFCEVEPMTHGVETTAPRLEQQHHPSGVDPNAA
jgi:hypothetical protein